MTDPYRHRLPRHPMRRARQEDSPAEIVGKSALRGFGWGIGRMFANLVMKGRP